MNGSFSGTGNLTLQVGGTSTGSSITFGASNTTTSTLTESGTITNSGSDTGANTVTINDAIGSNVTNVIENSAMSTLSLTNASGTSGSSTYGSNAFGALTIDSGTVIVKNTGDQGSGTIYFNSSASGTAMLDAFALNANSFTSAFTNAISVSGAGTNIIEATSYNPTFSGNITLNSSNLELEANNGGGSTLTTTGAISGTGNLILQSDNGSGSNIVLSSATNTVNNTGSITNNGTAGGTSTISEVIGSSVTNVIENSATSALTINGNNGANAFTGSLEIEAGTVNLENSLSTGAVASTGAIYVGTAGNGGAAATLNWIHSATGGYVDTVTNAIDVGGTGMDTISITGYDVIYTGPVALSNNVYLVSNNTGGSDLTLTGNITGTGNIVMQSNAAVGTNLSQVVLGNATSSINNVGTITNSGTGTTTTGNINSVINGIIGTNVTGIIQDSSTSALVLNNANLFNNTATTTLGILELDNSLALQNAILNMNGGSVAFGSKTTTVTAATVAGLSGSGNLALTNAASTPAAVALTVGNNNGSASYGGALSGAGSLIKTGTGTQTLSGTNLYTGTTSVNGGYLAVNGSLANTTTTVANGATLMGTGTSAGATTVQSGGFLLAGDGINTNTKLSLTNSLTMNTGSILEFTLGAGNTNSSLSLSGGSDSFASNQEVDFLNVQAGSYSDLITGLTADPGSEANWTLYNDPGYVATFTYSNGDISAVLTTVPEPNVTLLLLVGGLAVVFVRGRRVLTVSSEE